MSVHDLLYNPPIWLVVIALIFVFCQGVCIFRDAQKRGRYPWLWGLWGISNFPTPLIIYYFAVVRRDKRGRKNA